MGKVKAWAMQMQEDALSDYEAGVYDRSEATIRLLKTGMTHQEILDALDAVDEGRGVSELTGDFSG